MNAPNINAPRIFRPEPGDPGRPRRGLDDESLAQQTTVFREDLLEGHTILITGAGSGMGKAAAFLAARLGANVAICGRDSEKLEGTASLIREHTGKDILCQSTNIRDPDAVEALIARVHDHFGGWIPSSTTLAASSRRTPSTSRARAGSRSSTPTSTAPGG